MADRETVAALLTEAVEAVRDAGVPAEFEVVAFGKAVDLLSVAPVVPALPSIGDHGTRGGSGGGGAGAGKIQAIAHSLSLNPALVSDTYHLDGDDPKLSISASQLSASIGKAAQEVALLVAAARQGAGDEEWTTTGVIRTVAEHYGKLNHHFAEQIDDMNDVFSFRGSGRSRSVRLKAPGYEQAASLVKRLQGAE
jgi:hypothetical protein